MSFANLAIERAGPIATVWLKRPRRANALNRELMEELIRAMLDINQITIAAVHGAALGGGCCIATACDFRIGSVDAFCGYPEIDRGMNLQWRALPVSSRGECVSDSLVRRAPNA